MTHAIFSPTETQDYQRCPMYHAYKRRWQLRQPWQPHLALGNAIHAGIAFACEPIPPATPIEVARAVLLDEYVENDQWPLEVLREHVSTGLAAALKTEYPGEVIAVEEAIGRTRIDMVVRGGEGLGVVDHKISLKLDKSKLPYRQADADTLWQLCHEAWAVSLAYNEPVEWGYIHFVALTPRVFTHLHPVRMGAERLRHWYESATQWWAEMSMDFLPMMNFTSCNLYGGCPYKRACHELHGDDNKIAVWYDPVTRKGAVHDTDATE